VIISLPNGSKLTLSTKSDSAGGALTITPPSGVARPVAFGQQLRAELAPLGPDAVAVHTEALRAWVAVALSSDYSRGVKANRRNRENWERTRDLLETAQAAEQMQAVA
jgi:hypothetical protein